MTQQAVGKKKIHDLHGAEIDIAERTVSCWEDAPEAKCLVSFCTPETLEIELVALRSGETFDYEEWNGGKVVQKFYRCQRGLPAEG